ncbi:FGGY-family carbohydrate kinase [Psychromonas sp. Urea-02u-13]|uniref:FGGY-family carbohydrate kinase n=1 Tax=Psychromonas sp. Urea-02u-13 TaxID=2058326 RepID=UPI000C33D1F4|nr:FGGY-family carbohydrate kinase [Psychromonas sp. Urea-02u-13]PKG37399.1 ribulokinase [Psychromonas sp. Urea-02u-13]
MNNKKGYFLGVDVGTGSARAGIFSVDGALLETHQCAIALYKQEGGIVEQSSEDIWCAVVEAVRGAILNSDISGKDILGIGFDATCSLVVLGDGGEPLSVGDLAFPNRNIMVWMDHRAVEQAERINAIGHRLLDYVGGRISPEMETPKLLWLKENRPEIFNKACQFMDLIDFLTWRVTDDLARSVCTVTCKWTYMAQEKSWDKSYFEAIGLKELVDDNFQKIGTKIVSAGDALGRGLTASAAQELGLCVGTPVASGLIDAHAGGVGSVGAKNSGGVIANLAYAFGTSSCTMTSTREPVFVPGVWGPYYSAMVPGLWLNEGGQSVAGAAIDKLLGLHPYITTAKILAAEAKQLVPVWVQHQAQKLLGNNSNIASLAKGQHVVPEFLGNRAPHADPHTRAVITGLSMQDDVVSLVSLYIAGLCGIGYGLRQIVETQEKAGIKIARIVISGGAGKSLLVRQLLADATGIEITAPTSEEPVLLGSAILGSVAAGVHENINVAMQVMSSFDSKYAPKMGAVEALPQKRFSIFKDLQSIARYSVEC